MEITEKQIRELAADKENVILTEHIRKRLKARGIKSADISYTLKNSEIIEKYPDDFPFPSCLEFCVLKDGRPLHVCVGLGNNKLYLITAYYPDTDKWENDFIIRRERS